MHEMGMGKKKGGEEGGSGRWWGGHIGKEKEKEKTNAYQI